MRPASPRSTSTVCCASLEDEGLLARDGGRITFLNEHALARTAHHIDRTQHIDLGWLPPAR